MKNLPYVLMALAALALADCAVSVPVAYSVGTSAAMYYTRPDQPPEADTEHQLVAHESWCYQTMGYPECYPRAQKTDPNRLINVDPENHYPLTTHDYWDIVYAQQ